MGLWGVARAVGWTAVVGCWLAANVLAIRNAYQIRILAIETYGYVIHEFDPWFNFRATKYLAEHSIYEFFHWFDRLSWYPLGRSVGTTIYPGMQLTAVGLWHSFAWLRSKGLLTWWALARSAPVSINDVCCLVPAWFGCSATFMLGALAGECSNSWASGAAAALIMSIVPAHLMRSVGGGYDNESIALTALCTTFYCWCRSLRGPRGSDASSAAKRRSGAATWQTWVFGALTGLAYIYMVAAWGGFVFVLNLIGAHCFALVVLGRFTRKLHVAYTLFYVIGTAGAVMVPVVGWRPLKDMEQLPAGLMCFGLQFFAYAEYVRRARNLSFVKALVVKAKAAALMTAMILCAVLVLYPRGYFGPLSARVRGLFVKHTRTGNPLVDSVAEHQPANAQAYEQYLHHIYTVAPVGLALSFLRFSDANVFLWVYAVVAVYFCSKMARLIILLSPVASALGGVAIGTAIDHLLLEPLAAMCARWLKPAETAPAASAPAPAEEKKKKGSSNNGATAKKAAVARPSLRARCAQVGCSSKKLARTVYRHPVVCLARIALGCYLFQHYAAVERAREFSAYAHQLAQGLSQPSIMFKARLTNGEEVMVDDYREAYWWLRDKTPKDARILAWWDYGYQITGIGERTTLADGNTWNHEHIATLGRILSAPEEEAHALARHLADYVLVWSGGGGDDLAKSPHMARIGNSVYHDICPDDPTCSQFGFTRQGRPTPMMEKSLLYKMIRSGDRDQQGRPTGVVLNATRWQHVYSTRFGKVRIFKIKKVSLKSKQWVANTTNWQCDGGGWYCPGQYPPAVKWLIDKRKPFRQLEDFNSGPRDKDAERYHEEYHRRMAGKAGESDEKPPPPPPPSQAKVAAPKKLPQTVLKPVGCFRHESELPNDKVYGGGSVSTSVAEAVAFATAESAKYVALAHVDDFGGHAFAFNSLPAGVDVGSDAPGCANPCPADPDHGCGCADHGCAGLAQQADEEYLRRWQVYEVVKTSAKPRRTAKKAASEL